MSWTPGADCHFADQSERPPPSWAITRSEPNGPGGAVAKVITEQLTCPTGTLGLFGSQIWTCRSYPPDTTRPSASTATAVTGCSWRPSISGLGRSISIFNRVWKSLDRGGGITGLFGSQIQTCPFSPPVASRPSASAAIALASPRWWPNSDGAVPGLPGSQTFSNPVSSRVATRPSASTATAATWPLVILSWLWTSGRAGSHTRVCQFAPKVTTRPSASSAIAFTRPTWR